MTITGPRVALISMPFGPITGPALGLSLLKAALGRRAIPCDMSYFTLRLAAQIGFEYYNKLGGALPTSAILGEWLFAPALFGENAVADAQYVQHVLWGGVCDRFPPEVVLELLRLRQGIVGFIEACAAEVDWSQYTLVGFTMNFQQTCASLALARLIKAHYPQVKIILGGASCADETGLGLLRIFPFVDFVCNGEGDLVFPSFVESLFNDRPPLVHGGTGGDGVIARTDLAAAERARYAPIARDLDALPYPDHSDYFAQLRMFNPAPEFSVAATMETARGCWWGWIHPCTFCGLNRLSSTYRHKSPARALEEILYLRDLYGAPIDFADAILDHRYFHTLLPALAANPVGVDLFWEVKANLKREQVALLARAGVKRIQPGIESFSDALLKLMNKGTTCLQNIQTLKWCKQFDIETAWNFIYGFPGEDPAEYLAMQNLLPLLLHLDAPQSYGHILFDRRSAYLHDPARFGITGLTPSLAHQCVYHALSEDELASIAYHFDAEYEDISATYGERIEGIVKEWQMRTNAALDVFPGPQSIRIVDTRARGERKEYHFDGLAAEIYLQCDAARTRRALADTPSVRGQAAAVEISAVLGRFVDLGLMVHRGERYLSLAVIRGMDESANGRMSESAVAGR